MELIVNVIGFCYILNKNKQTNIMEYTLDFLFPKQTEVTGFSIPIKQLAEEQYKQDITLERIQDFHYEAGEDLLDTMGVGMYVTKLVAGFLMCKYPHLANEINTCGNSDICSIYNLFQDYFDEEGNTFYEDFCEVINYTEITKAKINQVLIQVEEYYKN